MNSSQCRELGSNRRGADGIRVKNFPGFTTLQILAEIQKMMTKIQCELEQFKGRIIFMSMYNDIVWGEKGNNELLISNSKTVSGYARSFAHGHLIVSQAGIRKEMVRNSHAQQGLGQCRGGYDDQRQSKRTSRVPWIQCFRTRIFVE